IRDVNAGKSALSPEITTKVIRQVTHHTPTGDMKSFEVLTKREIDVIRLAAKGMTNREIGRELQVSHRTIQGHLANVYGKLDVSSRTEAVTAALKLGWIVIE
ncbi:MAG: response regulator transcription factor, partial [Anaerolineae bacterium]|nr:response regulator transcription factor [Anaerolineae bacterium]